MGSMILMDTPTPGSLEPDLFSNPGSLAIIITIILTIIIIIAINKIKTVELTYKIQTAQIALRPLKKDHGEL